MDGHHYPTYVIKEVLSHPGTAVHWGAIMGGGGKAKSVSIHWYSPDAGVILKTESEILEGDFRDTKPGDIDQYSLVKITFPEGIATHALKSVPIPKGGAPDRALLAEVERLKREAEETRKADEARKAREAEADKARAAEIARLKQEAEEARRAADARKAREADEDKAREAEIARLRKEIENRRQADTQLTERESQQLAAREVEIARLRREVEERQRAEAERQAREQDQANAREAEITRRFAEAEEARKATAAEVERLKQEAEKAAKAREAEIARLKEALAKRPETVAASAPGTAAEMGGVEFGRYHALVIGIDNYQELPRLKTAVNDARAIAEVLEKDYGFAVTLLVNPDARTIVDRLDIYRETLGPKDNLLIYYAGHGWLDKEVDRGYWLPVDARPKRRSGWVSNATVSDTLKALSAKHVMVVADSCYSGTLVRSADVGTRTRTGDYWKRMAEKWARVAITSGGLEPVVDSAGGGHSPFAKAFIAALRANAAVMDGTQLFSQMRRPVMTAAQQTPQYADVREAGHDGGDFLFVRKK